MKMKIHRVVAKRKKVNAFISDDEDAIDYSDDDPEDTDLSDDDEEDLLTMMTMRMKKSPHITPDLQEIGARQ